MGINLTWVCKTHKLHHTSLRGEESIDFQALVREHPDCFKIGNITAWHDGFFADDGYTEVWPEWEDRPAERRKRGEDESRN